MTPFNPLSAGIVRELRAIARPGALLLDPAELWSYGYDNSRRQAMPQAVVLVLSLIHI